MIYNASISHPKVFSSDGGNTTLDTKLTSINRSIALILLTAKGELFGNPEFGSDIRYYLFNSITPVTTELIKTEIVNCLSIWEDRISIAKKDITIEQAENNVIIHLSYTLRGSNTMSSTDVFTQIAMPLEVQ